jgi:hypothetical protein
VSLLFKNAWVSLAPNHQHRRVDPGVGHFGSHGVADLVPAGHGADDAALSFAKIPSVPRNAHCQCILGFATG